MAWTVVVAALALPAACGDDNDNTGGGLSGTGAGLPGDCEVNGQPCPVLCNENLGCVDCLNDDDCGAVMPACVNGDCKECGSNADCATGESCYPKDHTCRPSCSADADCATDEPICDPDTSACVGCLSDADCPTATPICSTVTKQCVECASDADCGAARPTCNLSTGLCIVCLVDANCPAETPVCWGNTCIEEAVGCAPGWIDCGADGCVDPSSDPEHCGSCGTDCGVDACASGNCQCTGAGMVSCAGDGCVDVSSDPNHCGGCDNDCGQGQTCASGTCTCPGNATSCGNRCVDLQNDPRDCGNCGNHCNEDEFCVTGSCECKPGLTLVGNNCVDLQSDPNHCGTPNNQCMNTTDKCLDGGCVADCGNLDDCNNACVDTDTNPLHCGNCGGNNACDEEEVCVQGKCENWRVGLGCSTCPCSDACTGNFDTCCTYPNDTLTICVDGGNCP